MIEPVPVQLGGNCGHYCPSDRGDAEHKAAHMVMANTTSRCHLCQVGRFKLFQHPIMPDQHIPAADFLRGPETLRLSACACWKLQWHYTGVTVTLLDKTHQVSKPSSPHMASSIAATSIRLNPGGTLVMHARTTAGALPAALSSAASPVYLYTSTCIKAPRQWHCMCCNRCPFSSAHLFMQGVFSCQMRTHGAAGFHIGCQQVTDSSSIDKAMLTAF